MTRRGREQVEGAGPAVSPECCASARVEISHSASICTATPPDARRRARVMDYCPLGGQADARAAGSDHRRQSRALARGIFEREASALGKSGERGRAARDPTCESAEGLFHPGQGGNNFGIGAGPRVAVAHAIPPVAARRRAQPDDRRSPDRRRRSPRSAARSPPPRRPGRAAPAPRGRARSGCGPLRIASGGGPSSMRERVGRRPCCASRIMLAGRSGRPSSNFLVAATSTPNPSRDVGAPARDSRSWRYASRAPQPIALSSSSTSPPSRSRSRSRRWAMNCGNRTL